MTIAQDHFGTIENKVPVSLYTLSNKNGMMVSITNYGGAIVSCMVPDRNGVFDDVILGYDTLKGYLSQTVYLGPIIGRYCNRIAKGKFSLGKASYTLAINNGRNHLHGGLKGFDRVVWDAQELHDVGGDGLELHYVSADGEEGYPGELHVTVTYIVTDTNEIKINYSARTNKLTVVNLTNHAYFNLAGAGNGDILSHELMVNADSFLPNDATQIPTGEIALVEATPFDFRKSAVIGASINREHEQLTIGKGYDHTWVLNKKGKELSCAAVARDPLSGRTLEVLTTEPGVQVYTGNYLTSSIVGKKKRTYDVRSGFCCETQHFPDSPNKPHFPSTGLKPGEQYASETIYRFSVT